MSEHDHLDEVSKFELALDRALESRPTFASGGPSALRLAANVCEHIAAEHPGGEGRFVEGLQILAPVLVEGPTREEPDIETLFADLDFAAHYHLLRDYLYYTYNAPGTMLWEFGERGVKIRFGDPSLPRQFYLAANSWFVDSMSGLGDKARSQRIEELLTGTPEFEETAEAHEAMELIEREVADKLGLYFNFAADVDADLVGYTWSEQLEVYRLLLVKALYHRYHARVNGSRGAIFMNLDVLAEDLAESSEALSEEVARSAVLGMSFGPEAREAGLEGVYFSLYHLPDRNEIVMLPHHFALWEGHVSLLRLVALRDPALFNREFSGALGRALTRHLASVFESVGFSCLVEVGLREFGNHLPDIDLLVISQEPTLGYVVFVCEVKSPIPPRWAKDQLRVLAPDSVAKGFGQLERLHAFLASDVGIGFLRGMLPPEGLPDFDEFALLLNLLVVTSDNAGAFFSDHGYRIIDFRTLTRLVRRSDGDTAYVLEVLNKFGQWADAGLQIVPQTISVGDVETTYEGVTIKSLMDFDQTAFRSAGIPDELVRGMIESGAKPLDVLRERAGNDE